MVLPAEHAVGCRQHPLIRASCTLVCQANAIEKLLTAEASEVNSLNAVFGDGLSQEKTCYCVECDKLFHGAIPCFAYGMQSLPKS
jgi:hypothetical protein